LREVLQWEPAVSLEDGLDQTYHWIAGQLAVPQKLKTHEAGG
jgi:nucleoside-diphosphate-sugar epimerase